MLFCWLKMVVFPIDKDDLARAKVPSCLTGYLSCQCPSFHQSPQRLVETKHWLPSADAWLVGAFFLANVPAVPVI